MADINQAYEVLSDPEKKEQFDNGFDPYDPESAQQQHNPFGGGHHGGNPFAHHFSGGHGNGFPFGGGSGHQFSFNF
jgi:DnaJ family protein C protein 3